jgi:hypothetical protein
MALSGEALPVHFAALAWRVASGPIMAPGYVRRHPRSLAAQLEQNYWDGSLAASVDLITPWPRQLQVSCEWMKQTCRGWWHDRPTDFRGSFLAPSDEDITKRPYLLASASLRFAVPHRRLPHPPSARHAEYELEELARQSVAVLVKELNHVVEPVLHTFDMSR